MEGCASRRTDEQSRRRAKRWSSEGRAKLAWAMPSRDRVRGTQTRLSFALQGGGRRSQIWENLLKIYQKSVTLRRHGIIRFFFVSFDVIISIINRFSFRFSKDLTSSSSFAPRSFKQVWGLSVWRRFLLEEQSCLYRCALRRTDEQKILKTKGQKDRSF